MDDYNKFKEEYREWISKLDNFPYTNPATFGDKEEFPIVASGIVYKRYEDSDPEKDFKTLRQGGFNLCLSGELNYFTINKEYDDAADAKVKIIGWYSGFDDTGEGIYDWLYGKNPLNHDAFGGIDVWDEPRPEFLEGGYPVDAEGKKKGKSLWELYYYFKKTENLEYLAYINLLPLNREIKQDYALNYQKYFKPAFFCYDLYPLLEKSKLLYEGIKDYSFLVEGQITIDYDVFYENLEFFSGLSRLHSRPFWAFCESTSMFQLNSANYFPVALEQYLRFEAFSALAYGAKGIVYWTYALNKLYRKVENGQIIGETYLSALLDGRNNKMASWYYAKRVNDEIHKYSEIFLNGTWQQVVSTNDYLYYGSNTDFRLEILSMDSVDLLVAEFTKGVNTYILVVSKDMLEYHNITINVKTYNNEMASVTELTPITSKGEENTRLAIGENSRILPPGGYRIFRFATHIPKPGGPIN